MADLIEWGHSRASDPQTSHDAGRMANVTKREMQVLDALAEYPMTAQEVALYLSVDDGGITPRFRPLLEKRRIRVAQNPDGTTLTKTSSSGRQRQVYELQTDKSLWKDRVFYTDKKTERIYELEAAIGDIIQNASTGGIEYCVSRANRALQGEIK